MVKVLLGTDRADLLTSEELKAKIFKKKLLAKPSLAGLVYLLRHEELWGDFTWGFWDTSTCGVGLACKYWNLGFPCRSTIMEAMHIDDGTAGFLFYAGGGPSSMPGRRPKDWKWYHWFYKPFRTMNAAGPTAEQVAAWVERYINKYGDPAWGNNPLRKQTA